jgi:excisionase family DNA binding protein
MQEIPPSAGAPRNQRLDSTIMPMDRDVSLQRLEEALRSHRESLEELESALLEREESIGGEAQERPQERQGLRLLSISELCQELGMGKSWIYRRLRSGEIPSVKLGRSIKVKRADLEEYLEKQRYQPSDE